MLSDSQCCISRDPAMGGQPEAVWKGDRGSPVSCGSLPEDGWPRGFSSGRHIVGTAAPGREISRMFLPDTPLFTFTQSLCPDLKLQVMPKQKSIVSSSQQLIPVETIADRVFLIRSQ